MSLGLLYCDTILYPGGEEQSTQKQTSQENTSDYAPARWMEENAHTQQVQLADITINAKEMFKFLGTTSKPARSSLKNTYDDTTKEFLTTNTAQADEGFDASAVPTKGGLVLEYSIAIFSRRICTNLVLKVIFKINGSLELTCRYFETVVDFIHSIIQTKDSIRISTLCPFQVFGI